MTLALFAALLALYGAPFLWERLKPRVKPDLAPGKIANLPSGQTHYRWQGPPDGPVVACIHGLTTPSYIWEQVATGLAEAGHRVLSYDLYGRGFSGRPTGDQDAGFFLRQLQELLDDQQVSGAITLLGYSMGGSIATAYTCAHPDKVTALWLLAPAGIEHNPTGLAEICRKVPVLGDWLMLVFGGAGLMRAVKAIAGEAEPAETLTVRQRAEIDMRGYLPAVLSSMRHMLAENQRDQHMVIAASKLPVIAIWGAGDTVIPLSAHDILTDWNPNARHFVIQDAGHALAATHAKEVLASLPIR